SSACTGSRSPPGSAAPTRAPGVRSRRDTSAASPGVEAPAWRPPAGAQVRSDAGAGGGALRAAPASRRPHPSRLTRNGSKARPPAEFSWGTRARARGGITSPVTAQRHARRTFPTWNRTRTRGERPNAGPPRAWLSARTERTPPSWRAVVPATNASGWTRPWGRSYGDLAGKGSPDGQGIGGKGPG